MRKFAKLGLVAAMIAAPMAASAADGGWFIAGDLGQSNWDNASTENFASGVNLASGGTNLIINTSPRDTFYGLRGGYRWGLGGTTLLGVETGYVNFGQMTGSYNNSPASVATGKLTAKSNAFLLGGNVRFAFTDDWYGTVRAGLMRNNNKWTPNNLSIGGMAVVNNSTTKHGWGQYAGFGVGYNINPNLSVGLNLDGYRLGGDDDLSVDKHENISVWSISGEYRF